MLQKITQIPISKQSYPFASAEKYCNLKNNGYEELEYRMQGTANVYCSSPTYEAIVWQKDVPYTNRFIVRQPKDLSKASGNIFVEIINPTSFMDIDRMWILGHPKFIRDNDIYVGITSKPNTLNTLKAFNKDRYKDLDWPNRNDKPFPFDVQTTIREKGLLPDIDPSYEPGLFWDMLMDLSGFLRHTFLPEIPHKTLYLTGWSQSANYLYRFLNSFAYAYEKEEPFFDGYLAAGGLRNFAIPLNQYESHYNYPKAYDFVFTCKQPFIILQTESENHAFGAKDHPIKPSFLGDFKVVQYDITGATHDTLYSYIDYYKNDADLEKLQILPIYVGHHPHPNDYPSYIFISSMYGILTQWVTKNVLPPQSQFIQIDENGQNAKDENGNTKGGLRSCLLDYPLATYYSYSNIDEGDSFLDPSATINPLFGHQVPFTKDELQKRYGSLKNYRQLILAHTAKQIEARYLTPEDGDALVNLALAYAKELGLH